MNTLTRNILLAIAAIIPVGNVLAQIPDGYYDALKGKKGAELKTAVHKKSSRTPTCSTMDQVCARHGGDSI